MKCILCVNRSLKDKDISTTAPVQDGVDGARDAVVTRNGDSLCVEHLHERIQNMGIQEYLNAVVRT